MFKQENHIWFYLIGIILLFGVLVAITTNVMIPVVWDPKSIDTFGNSFTTAPEFIINPDLDYQAVVTTNMGAFTIDLFEDNAPQNVNNFVYLSQNNYYVGTSFFRLIPNYLFQGGDRNTLNNNPSDDGLGRPGYTIDDETNWDNNLNLDPIRRLALTEQGYSSDSNVTTDKYEKYFVGMANGGPNSNGSQFFIMINNPNDPRLGDLNGMFTPIGKVTSGYDTIETISQIPVDSSDPQLPRPTQSIIVQSVSIITQ